MFFCARSVIISQPRRRLLDPAPTRTATCTCSSSRSAPSPSSASATPSDATDEQSHLTSSISELRLTHSRRRSSGWPSTPACRNAARWGAVLRRLGMHGHARLRACRLPHLAVFGIYLGQWWSLQQFGIHVNLLRVYVSVYTISELKPPADPTAASKSSDFVG